MKNANNEISVDNTNAIEMKETARKKKVKLPTHNKNTNNNYSSSMAYSPTQETTLETKQAVTKKEYMTTTTRKSLRKQPNRIKVDLKNKKPKTLDDTPDSVDHDDNLYGIITKIFRIREIHSKETISH